MAVRECVRACACAAHARGQPPSAVKMAGTVPGLPAQHLDPLLDVRRLVGRLLAGRPAVSPAAGSPRSASTATRRHGAQGHRRGERAGSPAEGAGCLSLPGCPGREHVSTRPMRERAASLVILYCTHHTTASPLPYRTVPHHYRTSPLPHHCPPSPHSPLPRHYITIASS